MTDYIRPLARRGVDCPPPSNLRTLVSKLESGIACALPTCGQALALAKLKMPDGGLAEKMLDHFRSGDSSPVEVDLDRELARNPHLKQLITSRIEQDIADRLGNGESPAGISGAIWIDQWDYGSTEAGKDQRLALGGTFFEYQVVATDDDGGLLTRLHVSDYYFWSPGECRPTECLHQCGASLVAAGEATEFYQTGEGALGVRDPREGDPTPEPAREPVELR